MIARKIIEVGTTGALGLGRFQRIAVKQLTM
jgi:hypothetical protein